MKRTSQVTLSDWLSLSLTIFEVWYKTCEAWYPSPRRKISGFFSGITMVSLSRKRELWFQLWYVYDITFPWERFLFLFSFEKTKSLLRQDYLRQTPRSYLSSLPPSIHSQLIIIFFLASRLTLKKYSFTSEKLRVSSFIISYSFLFFFFFFL